MFRKKSADQPKIPWYHRTIGWVKRHQVWSLIIAGIFLIVVATGVAAILLYQHPEKVAKIPIIPKPKPKPVAYYSPLNGLKVATKADETAPVTGVMIENSPDARPQSGLKQADVVYEAIAEGGITRFLALYQPSKPSLIGPVRSVRAYDLDWLLPYQASLAHVGGSAQALKTIRSGGAWRDLDQFFNAGSYWRSTDRYAPHNVYTTMKRLNALEKSKGYKTSKFTSFPRQDGKASKKPTASKLTINFSSALFNTTYAWHSGCNCYYRSQGGAPHKDREKGQIAPKIVVAMKVNEKTVFQDGYRQQITTSGKGEADVFQNGTITKATWYKKDRNSPLELLDKNGKQVSLVRGQTWIAAVPNGEGSISWR